jgi:SSS family solute:Na+ symporter
LSIYLLLFVIWPLWWRLALLTVIGLSRVGGWSELTTSAPEGFLSMVKPTDHPDYPITGFMFGNLFVGIFYWYLQAFLLH